MSVRRKWYQCLSGENGINVIWDKMVSMSVKGNRINVSQEKMVSMSVRIKWYHCLSGENGINVIWDKMVSMFIRTRKATDVCQDHIGKGRNIEAMYMYNALIRCIRFATYVMTCLSTLHMYNTLSIHLSLL